MKRRMIKTALAAMLMLLLSISFAAASASSFQGSQEFSTLLDVSAQSGSGGASQYFMSYAFTEQGKTAVKWKDIKPRDLTIGLKWDISKIIKKPGKLFLSPVAANENKTTSVSECESATGDVTYTIYNITAIAPKPAPINKSKIIYTDTDAYIDIGVGNEWSKDGYTWQSADSNGPNSTAEKWCRVTPSAGKQIIYVRGKASTGETNSVTMPSSKSVKVTISAIPKAPKVNLYLARGFLSARAGMEISNDGKVWAKMTDTTLPLGTITSLPASSGSGVVKINSNNNQFVHVRIPFKGNKPPSNVTVVQLIFTDAGVVGAEHFITTPNMKIKVDSSVAVEAYIGGKWKKIKQISADSISSDGLKVRMAGSKERLFGPERTLRLVSSGGYREISVS